MEERGNTRRLTAFCIAFMTLAAVSCSDVPEWDYVQRPQLDDSTLTLNVAYVENPRFCGLDDATLGAILERSSELVEEHFGLRVRFSKPQHLTIQSLFNNLLHHVKQARADVMIHPDQVDEQQKLRLRDSLYETLESYWNDRELVTDFARPYLVAPLPEDDFHKLADRLVDTLLQRLEYWYQQQAEDGEPVLDGTPYNEWVWWDSLGYGNMPWDVVITNQLVASAEFYGMDVHSSLRGGISAGTTSYSKNAQFSMFSWISVYQMLHDNEVLSKLRDDAHYDQAQVVEYSAMLLTHELGHLLLLLGHPFGNQYCVMAPTPLLKYRKWVAGIDPAMCPLGSEEQMTPGVAKLEYNTRW